MYVVGVSLRLKKKKADCFVIFMLCTPNSVIVYTCSFCVLFVHNSSMLWYLVVALHVTQMLLSIDQHMRFWYLSHMAQRPRFEYPC